MVAQSPAHIVVAGRTDKGVHARAQVMSFSFPELGDTDIDINRLMHVCNQRLNPQIVVHDMTQAPEDFNARHSAKARTYRYFIDTSARANFMLSDWAWHVYEPLDIDAMTQAAKHFVGEHDFTSVCRNDDSKKNNIREVATAEFLETVMPEMFAMPSGEENLLCFEISANGFCWQMVRSIVGVLVQVGKGNVSADEIPELLAKKERVFGSLIAPAHGLILWDVRY